MNNIVLSIVIPTYNRAQLLKGLIESIVQDMGKLPNDLELIVSDNASPDETKDIVAAFISRGFPINYLVNETNIGADGNVAACFNLAAGKYLWMIGDDEVLFRGATQYVLELCRKFEFGVLHLSTTGFHNGEQNTIKDTAIPNNIKIVKLGTFDFIRRVNINLTFISANIVNKQEILNQYPNFNYNAELNSNLPQLAWIYTAIKTINVNYYVQTSLLGALMGNSGGYSMTNVFGTNLLRITKKYFEVEKFDAERIMSNAVITRWFPSHLMSQFEEDNLKNNYIKENTLEALKKCFGKNLYFLLFIKPFFSQFRLIRELAFLYIRLFNKINKKINFSML